MAHRWRTKKPTAADAARKREYNSRRHRTTRKAWQQRIDDGEMVVCARRLPGCAGRIHPGMAWDLDHTDDRSDYLGPSCPGCNRKAAARKSNQAQRAKRNAARAKPRPLSL